MRRLLVLALLLPACGRPVAPSSGPSGPASASAAPSAAPPKTPEAALAALLDGHALAEIPVLRLDGDRLSLDGKPVGIAAGAPPVAEARAALRGWLDAWRTSHAGKPFHGLLVLRSSAAASVAVWKTAFATAVMSGFPNLVVQLDEHAAEPFPLEPTIPGGPPGAAEAVGTLDVAASGAKVAWAGGAAEPVAGERLAAALCQGWRAHGRHRTAEDRRFDLVDLRLASDASLAALVPLARVGETCRRPTPTGDGPAFFVRLVP